MPDLLTIVQASQLASEQLKRKVTPSNISYLIQYGRIKKISQNGNTFVDKDELLKYYKNSYNGRREIDWKKKLGDDLNWHLSFDHLREADTTKHVHRLHPYKGKFIPQLVEYFLNTKTDEFKKEVYFRKGDIILDPFCGSGTTLVQSNEMGMHAIGIDISSFNTLISNVKVQKTDFSELRNAIKELTEQLKQFIDKKNHRDFENRLLQELNKYNNKFFPSPEYKYQIRNGTIDEKKYSKEKENEFQKLFSDLVDEYQLKLKQDNFTNTFLDKWYLNPVREEIDFMFEKVRQIKDIQIKKIVSIILSRTIRSCRATTHTDLATLKEPVTSTYYCKKHGKICKPIFSILNWWERYSHDTIKRLAAFDKLRTNTYQFCLTGDSRTLDLVEALKTKKPEMAKLVSNQKINGIFTSPPYVGLIDYHEQHAYAYDLFGFPRQDNLEIGPLYKGRGNDAKKSYIEGISKVLNNCKNFLADNHNIFIVANDKFNMYPTIAEKAGMQIVNKYRRPVLNRTEKDKGAYAEDIFHLKSK